MFTHKYYGGSVEEDELDEFGYTKLMNLIEEKRLLKNVDQIKSINNEIINIINSKDLDYLNFKNTYGNNVLHIAVNEGDVEIVKLLLKKNLNKYIENNKQTALNIAEEKLSIAKNPKYNTNKTKSEKIEIQQRYKDIIQLLQ